MIPYQTKKRKLPGTDAREVYKMARAIFDTIKRRTKRKPYIRSTYFNKQKVFFDFFWQHLAQKKSRRIKKQVESSLCLSLRQSKKSSALK